MTQQLDGTIVGHDPLGLRLCRHFGLDPKKVRSLTLECAAGQIAELVVTEFVLADDGEFDDIIRRFEVRELTGNEEEPR